jgi:hypothetical protein
MLSISHTTYPDRTLDFELWLRYLAMGGRSFDEWVNWFEIVCKNNGGILKHENKNKNKNYTWRLKPHYQHGTNKIVDVELWKGSNDYALSFEEKAILVKILKRKL